MIYLFEGQDNNAGVVYNENSIPEADKLKGIGIEVLPEPHPKAGVPVLKCRKSTSEVWYEYLIDTSFTLDTEPTTVEMINATYLETQYQTVLLEMQSGM